MFKVFWIFLLLCKFENKIVCILLADWKNNHKYIYVSLYYVHAEILLVMVKITCKT